MNAEKWDHIKYRIGSVHQRVIDNSGAHPGSVQGKKIRVNGPKIARGKKPMGVVYFATQTQHERVVEGRFERQKLAEQGFKK